MKHNTLKEKLITSVSCPAVSSPSSSGVGLYCFRKHQRSNTRTASRYGREQIIRSTMSSLALAAITCKPSSVLETKQYKWGNIYNFPINMGLILC